MNRQHRHPTSQVLTAPLTTRAPRTIVVAGRLAPWPSLLLGLVALALTSCWEAPSHAHAEGEEAASPDAHGHVEEAARIGGHDHGDEGSDLDRSVEDLLAADCEHGVATHECAECRYEVGMVLVDDRMLDPSDGVLRTTLVDEGTSPAGRELNGEVRLNEALAVHLSPVSPGIVRAIHADVGQRVRRGQVLFEVESAELREAKATYHRALAAEALATATQERERDLFARGVCPRRDLEEADAALARARADRQAASGALLALGLTDADLGTAAHDMDWASSGLMPVRAPFDGVVLERSLSLGAAAGPGDESLLLADTNRVWVITALYEGDLAAVLEAQGAGPVEARVSVLAYPGRTFVGTIESISGTIDPATRASRARVVVDNREGLLRAGMFARVRLRTGGTGGGIEVPADAVLADEGRDFVFVRLDGQLFIRRPVAVGRRTADRVEVLAGLEPGAEIVTTGAFLLKSDVLRGKMGAGCAD